MSGDVHTPTNAGPDPVPPIPGSAAEGPDAPGWTAYAPADEADRPEILVGAAFAGGLIAALILKRVGSHDD